MNRVRAHNPGSPENPLHPAQGGRTMPTVRNQAAKTIGGAPKKAPETDVAWPVKASQRQDHAENAHSDCHGR